MASRLSSELVRKTRGKVGRGTDNDGGQMQNLLGEFKGLYEGRLKKLEEAEAQGDETLRVYFHYYWSELSINVLGLRLGLRMDFLLCPILRPNILGHILFK